MPHCWKLSSDWLNDSRHTLNVNPEQSPPSPPVAGSSRGSFGESSRSLSFQQPPAHWYTSTRARHPPAAEPSRVMKGVGVGALELQLSKTNRVWYAAPVPVATRLRVNASATTN